MKKKINIDAVALAVENLLLHLGADIDREGLRETPMRVAKMYAETLEGMRYTNDEIVSMFGKCFEDVQTGELVTLSGIKVFSYCEHHMALMYDMEVSVGYIPSSKVIGLSKVARVADMVCKRLQLQERIGMDILYILQEILGTKDVIVVVEGYHSCMTARGVRSLNAKTRTAALDGQFRDSTALRQEFYNLIK